MVAASNRHDALPAPVRALYPFAGALFTQPGGVQQHFVDVGAGPPILFVHGNPTWSFLWRDLIGACSARHRCVAPDHIGSGLSDKPADWSYRLADHIDNLVRLIEHLDLRDLTVVVHDWGGAIGLGAAGRVPDRVSRLVIFNTGVGLLPNPPLSIRACAGPLGPLLVGTLNGFLKVGLIRATSDRARMRGAIAQGFLAPYPTAASRIGQVRFINDIPFDDTHPSAAAMKSVRDGLKKLADRPTLIVWGEQDFVFTPEYRKQMSAFFPHARVIPIASASHWVTEDAADQVKKELTQFLGAP